MGKRYNAEKKKIGMYYTTPILQFSMKCHLCPNMIIIVTDPKNTKYEIIAGARLRIEDYDPKDIGLIELQDEKKTEKLSNDAFYKLEHGVVDTQKSVDSRHSITRLQDHNDTYSKDTFKVSQQVIKYVYERFVRNFALKKKKRLRLKMRLDLLVPD
jgi:coiled-coil domain-containing protein 130